MEQNKELKDKFLKHTKNWDYYNDIPEKEDHADACAKIAQQYSDEQNAELKKQFEYKYAQWEKQMETISNFHEVVKKHFPHTFQLSSYLDKEIIKLKSQLATAQKALVAILNQEQLITRTIAKTALNQITNTK
jgi:hypothetical protein